MKSSRTRKLMKTALIFVAMNLFCLHAAAQALEIDILPTGIQDSEIEAIKQEVLNSPEVRKALDGIRYRVLSVDADAPSSAHISLTLYDYSNDRVIQIEREDSESQIKPQAKWDDSPPPLPTQEEYEDAVKVIAADPILGPDLSSGKLQPYPAMPPLFDPVPGGGKRVMPIGLTDKNDPSAHEIIAVDLSKQKIERFTRRSPPESIATTHVCGPTSAGQRVTRVGTRGSASIVVRRGSEVLWQMNVTRPSASGGRWGSGIELRDVTYRNRLVFRRAHAPVLNVDYINNVCGPYRDPVNNENAFNVGGTEIAPGFIKAASVPQTIFETKEDRGDFWGVAVYEDASELVLMSEISAGWYRYASEWRFNPNGTIRPFFKFDAVHNSCTCEAHNHHVYWRFDFDIEKAKPNGVDVLTSRGWSSVRREAKFLRNAEARAFRVSNRTSDFGYQLEYGPFDGTANRFGSGDVWVLKYQSNEIDDSRFGSSKDAKLDRFLNNAPVEGEDLVMWYAGHILHAEDGNEDPHIAGPVLRPIGP